MYNLCMYLVVSIYIHYIYGVYLRIYLYVCTYSCAALTPTAGVRSGLRAETVDES